MLNRDELNKLYRYAIALSNDENRAYDLVHSALVRASAKVPDNKMSYLRTVIRNIFYDEARRNNKFPEEPISDSDPVLLDERSLENILIDKDMVAHLTRNIEPIDREILYLYAVEEMTFTEISKYTGIKRGTLLARLHRLRKKIEKTTGGSSETETQ